MWLHLMTNNWVLKIFPFITLLLESLTKLQSPIWVVLIYCVGKSCNIRLPFLSSQNSMNAGFLDTNLTRTLSQWLLWGACKNLHDCISTLVISGTSLSSAPSFQHIFHRSIDFKLVSDSCYTLVGSGLPNSTLQRRWTSRTFSTFQLHVSNHQGWEL